MRQDLDVYPRVEVTNGNGTHSAGFGWVLYLADLNTDCNGRDTLEYEQAVNGEGNVAQSTKPTTGLHKMSEDHVDEFGFTEVLALDSFGSWMKCWKEDGGTYAASEVFIAGISSTSKCQYNGETTVYTQPVISSSGPIFNGHVSGTTWGGMWHPTLCDKGAVRGTRQSNFEEFTTTTKWWWYGRNKEVRILQENLFLIQFLFILFFFCND